MSRLGMVWLLAGWEFRRYFKWRDVLVSICITFALLVATIVIGGIVTAAVAAENAPMRLAVDGTAPFDLDDGATFAWVEIDGAARDAAQRGDIDGYLAFTDDATGTVHADADGAWSDELRLALNTARQRARTTAYGLDDDALADILAPFDLDLAPLPAAVDPAPVDAPADSSAADAAPAPQRPQKVIAIGLLVITMMGVMLGTSFLFIGITSEKQARVTEQIVAATPPQLWIDGKIVGLALRSLVSTAGVLTTSIIGIASWAYFIDPDLTLLDALTVPTVLCFALYCVLGYAIWFCYFAAIAASIDDPNSSSRGVVMFVPMLAVGLVMPVYIAPHGVVGQLLTMLPPFSPLAMPMRMTLTDVPWWHHVISITGQLAAIWFLRRIAGRVFALGIMMHGKEPGWGEMLRAARRAH